MNDLAGLLSTAEAEALERKLAAFEAETSHQVAVLCVPTLEGEPIESFSLRVVEAWKVGYAGLDNGVLVLVASRDREARIEVGYGLEGVLPDAVASRILRDHMFPRFREGRMAAGIEAGVDAVLRAARGEEVPPARRPGPAPDAGDPVGIVLLCAFAGGMIGAGVARRRRARAAALGAGLAGLGTWWLLEAVPWVLLAAGLGGAFAVAGPGAGRLSRGGFGRAGRGGGFGGFGGGGFGGGGASGRW